MYFFLQFKLRQEGFDYHTVPDVYVHDLKLSTYVPLTSDVYDSIVNGRMKVQSSTCYDQFRCLVWRCDVFIANNFYFKQTIPQTKCFTINLRFQTIVCDFHLDFLNIFSGVFIQVFTILLAECDCLVTSFSQYLFVVLVYFYIALLFHLVFRKTSYLFVTVHSNNKVGFSKTLILQL